MRVLIVDDEPLALDFLEKIILKNNQISLVKKTRYAQDVISIIQEENIELAFIDIKMPVINGLELAELILSINPSIYIVFVTAFDEYAVKAFELNAIDYLLKPIKQDRINKSIDRVSQQKKQLRSNLTSQENITLNVANLLSITDLKGKIQPLKWRTTKARELFLYLLQNKNDLINREFLTDLLWPEFNYENAVNQLYTTIYHIRKTILPYQNYMSLASDNGGYILRTKDLEIDLEIWERNIKALPILNQVTLKSYQRLLQNYPGNYLEQYDYAWAEKLKRHFQNIWLECCWKVISHLKKDQKWLDAISWLNHYIDFDESDEQAHFELMKLYAISGENDKIRKQYQILTRMLKTTLNKSPDKEIRLWYQKWQKYH